MKESDRIEMPGSALWEAIPAIDFDLEAVQQRGRRLRRRRRIVAAVGSTAALALAGALALGLSQLPRPGVAPAATSDTSTTPSDQATHGATNPEPDLPASPGPTSTPADDQSSSSEIYPPTTPRMTEDDLRTMAVAAGLTIDWVNAEGNMLDARLVDPAGTQISVTITAADPEQVTGAIANAVHESNYQERYLGDVALHFKPAGAPGESAHWLFASADGTQMISVIAAPPGAEANGNPLSEESSRNVEAQLLPVLAVS